MTKTQRKAARIASARRVVIYVRVSTEEQRQGGAGIEAQIAECRSYAERHGLEVIEVIVEAAVSGKTVPASRPGYGRALALLDGCQACGLLVRRQDRISRNLRHFLSVVDDAAASGWAIITTDGKLDTTTAAGQFQVNMMATVAEYERKVIGERTKEALASRKAAGVTLGRPAVLTDDVVARILADRAAGKSMSVIAAGLEADGIPTARGGAWTKASVQSVLSSERAKHA